MDILGIGVPELVFILIIALIVLGPKDMQKAGKTVGKWMRKVVMSDEWKGIKNASRRLRTLPNTLMREASLDELENELGVSTLDKYREEKLKMTLPKNDFGTWGGSSASRPVEENRIAPSIHETNEAANTDEGPVPAKSADAQPQTDSANSISEEPGNA